MIIDFGRLKSGIAHMLGKHKNDAPNEVVCWCARKYPSGFHKNQTMKAKKEPKPFL